MQLVDPFIPAGAAPRQPKIPPTMGRRPQGASLDGFKPHPSYRPAPRPEAEFVHPRTMQTPQQPARPPLRQQPSPKTVVKPQPKSTATPKTKKRGKGRKFLTSLGQAMGIMLAVALGFLVQSPIIGQAAILLYGIFALVFKVASRTTFMLALMSLAVVLIGSVRSNTTLASTFAIYVFLFLGIGTLSLARELRNEI